MREKATKSHIGEGKAGDILRRRIQRLAAGKFEQEQPVLSLSEEKIEIEVLEGQDYTGEFVIEVSNHVPVKGLIYSSNPYMECLTPEFEGEEVRIGFQFHSEGFRVGDIQKGEFCIICNQLEYSLSFVVSIIRPYGNASTGRIRNLSDFIKLAQTDYMEAYRLFASQGFQHVLKEEKGKELLWYAGFGGPGALISGMEEFLVTINAKPRIELALKEQEITYQDIKEEQKETLFVQKNGWGYISFEAQTDSSFLKLEKNVYTSDDFTGSICDLIYYIDPAELHTGKNYGRITLENIYQHLTYEITIIRTPERREQEHIDYLEEQGTLAHITGIYLNYRMKKIGAGLFALGMLDALNHLIAMRPENDWYLLMKIQALLVSGQKQEAEWLFDEFRRKEEAKDTPLYAYFLYLRTLWEREESYVNRLTAEIEEIYQKTDDIRVFWMLLFLKKEYCENDTRKIRAIESQMLDGCNSPFFYIEGFYLYWQNPYLLTRLTDFEIRILYWAAKKGVLTSDLAMQITTLVSEKRVFHPLLYKTMCMAYDKFQNNQMLSAICAYLIRGQRFGLHYHIWFERGVEEDLRLAGLNEAYLMSMDLLAIKKIPRMIQMYFQYNSSIPYKQKAALLANVAALKEKEPEVYSSYRKRMEEFAIAQIEEGHIDDNLAIIYSDLLNKGMIQKEMAGPLAKILFTHKMNCFAPNIVRMYVLHDQLRKVQCVPIVNGSAYFELYSKDYVIVFEDTKGYRYGSEISYQLEKLMRPGAFYRTCMEYAPYEISYLLYHFTSRDTHLAFMPEDSEYLRIFLKEEALRESYRAELYAKAVHFYEQEDNQELVEECLRHAPLSSMKRDDRAYLLNLMLEYRLYEIAYPDIREFGWEGIRLEKLTALLTYEIEEVDYESDDFLLALCAVTFQAKKYSKEMLQYLAQFYCGPTRVMAAVWSAAQTFDIDTRDLEERLLMQMLYTAEFVEQVQSIYESFVSHGAPHLLQKAYVNYFAHFYFVHQGIVPENVIRGLKKNYEEQEELSQVMKLALLYAVAKRDLSIEEKGVMEMTEQLLQEQLAQNLYFAFYQQMPEEIRYRFHFYDRKFLEYRTNPSKRVVVHYQKGESYVDEDMNEMYEGIFVKEFIVFFGEEIPYYISEEAPRESVVTESGRLSCKDVCGRENGSTYDMLNEMELEYTLKDYEKLERLLRKYDSMKKRNEERFQLM